MEQWITEDPFPMVALYRAFDRDDRARRNLAVELLAQPERIADAFAATRTAILPYENPEAFHDARREHPVADTLAATKDVALRLACGDRRHQVVPRQGNTSESSFDFVYLDRELVPTRTTSAQRDPEVQLPTTQLRLDVLLAAPDGIPIVGEIKIKRDRDLSYALIQALACVSLLSTPHQSRRLAHHYTPHLATVQDHSLPFEIYLIAIPRTDRATYLDELDALGYRLAKAVLQSPSLASTLRRITKVTARLTGDQLRLIADWSVAAPS